MFKNKNIKKGESVMFNKDNLAVYLIENCKISTSIENPNKTWHSIYMPLANPKLDTEYQKNYFHVDKNDMENGISSKYYKWYSGGADIGQSFKYVVKRILNDFKKGIINITEFQADNKIQVSARKSTNNNPELKTKGENDE